MKTNNYMLDVSQIPDNKYSLIIKPLIISLAIWGKAGEWDSSAIGFLLFIITWGAKIFTICFTGLWMYDWIMNEYRYRQWAKTNFDPEQKVKYRIK